MYSMDRRFGWLRDLPDFRDYDNTTPSVQGILVKSKSLSALQATPRTAKTDLRQYCSPIEDQGNLGSCTAHAGAGLLEYYQKRARGKFVRLSRLFIYKTTRDLLGINGDQGASLRGTMQSMVMLGAPPESYCPYNISKFDTEPSSFQYALAGNFKTLQYYRLDQGPTRQANLDRILNSVAAGLPCMFGFTVYSSFPMNGQGALIPMPKQGDTVLGGHAVIVVGYDDTQRLLTIRNSWGARWGAAGYGYMPYDYVLNGLADDFWNVVQESYVDTSLFQ